MRILNIISKSLKEQLRSYWVLLLSLSMGPFFIFVYFLITTTTKSEYCLIVANNDKGILSDRREINCGNDLIEFFQRIANENSAVPFNVNVVVDKTTGIEKVKNKKADAFIIIDNSFSQAIFKRRLNDSTVVPKVEFIGDLTNTNYLISVIYANEILNEYTLKATHKKRIVEVKETALGTSSNLTDFDSLVPGILIVSLIMLMFTASIAFVSEIENKTIMRLKLSKLTAFEFLGGISVVQLLVGVVSILITLFTAMSLGFHYAGSIGSLIFIASLTSFSIIAFSLIIAALTKSANEVLVVGNFPMFLFLFFTGAAFPLKSDALFTIVGYPISIQGLLSPTHAISALNKTLIMNMEIYNIIPEIISIVTLTFFYFVIGGLIFKRRHLKLI